jgi:hypothetical protein
MGIVYINSEIVAHASLVLLLPRCCGCCDVCCAEQRSHNTNKSEKKMKKKMRQKAAYQLSLPVRFIFFG